MRPAFVNLVSRGALPCFITRAFPKDSEAVIPVKEYCNKIEVLYKDFSILTHQNIDACILYARYFKL